MRKLTAAGQRRVDDLAERHRFSPDAVASMLNAMVNGRGSMAQFNHPEFGGSGQWMRGGMIMLSDMFDNHLKSRVDGLCRDLAEWLAHEPEAGGSGSSQAQSQSHSDRPSDGSGDGLQRQDEAGPAGPVSLFVPAAGGGASAHWWPAGLGQPNSTGAQNDVRYAYFGPARRLAIESNGRVTVYDTLDHRISGFSQQQSVGGSLTFSSQHGLVDVASLPVATPRPDAPPPDAPPPTAAAARKPSPAVETAPKADPPAAAAPAAPVRPAATENSGPDERDILATIEKLAELHRKGILSDDEFASKKTELLGRL